MRRVIFAVAITSTLLLLAGCERWELDRQMEELCKKDGGLKVYETVTLPASYFDSSGALKLGPSMVADVVRPGYRKDFRRIGDDEYRVVMTDTFIAGYLDANAENGKGHLSRVHTAIYRWPPDRRLLGEQVWYARSGGDWFTFGFQPSGSACPHFTIGITRSVFIKGE